MNTQYVSSTKHFHFRQLCPGVYAALARPDGMAASNCGLVDLGDWTAVIDTSLSVQSAMDLREAAMELTGRDANLVFLTHHHFDHAGGCQAFTQATSIFSSTETYKLLMNSGSENLAQSREVSAQELASGQNSLKIERDITKREEILRSIRAAEDRLASAASAKQRLPDFSSQGQAALYGQARKLEFIPFPKAHCAGNSLVYLPQDGVLFVGDILFARRHPFMKDGDPAGWLQALDHIEKLKPEIIVPGHGGVSSLEEIHMLRGYLHVITDAVHAFVRAGKPAQALHEITLPEPYNRWEPRDFLAGSLAFLYEHFTESGYVQNPML